MGQSLIRCPACASRCDHVVSAPMLEQGRCFTVLANQYRFHSVRYIKIVFSERSNVEFTVFHRRVYEIGYVIIILEDSHISAIKTMRMFAIKVVERAIWVVADGYAYSGFGIVSIVNMHPHNILSGVLVVQNFWPLKNIGFMKIMGLVGFLSCKHNTLILPCPQVLGRVASNSDDVNACQSILVGNICWSILILSIPVICLRQFIIQNTTTVGLYRISFRV
uniref:Uncharacterized protein n=1 Tax=Opuntia streptacantha TaxID=393608 RepID=A0A7C8ZRZ7_OPUST